MNSIIDAQLTLLEWKHNIVVDQDYGPDYPLLYNDKICHVDYNDKENAVFQCEDKGYIWKKPNTLYLMTDMAYIRLLLKIDNVYKEPGVIKNVIV